MRLYSDAAARLASIDSKVAILFWFKFLAQRRLNDFSVPQLRVLTVFTSGITPMKSAAKVNSATASIDENVNPSLYIRLHLRPFYFLTFGRNKLHVEFPPNERRKPRH